MNKKDCKKNNGKTIMIGIVVVIVFGLLIFNGIVRNMNNSFEDYVKRVAISDVNEGETLRVNRIEYASKRIELGDIKLEVKNRKLYINNKVKYIDDDGVVAVTGYFYQPADTYYIYVLTGDEEVYSLTNVFEDEISEREFREHEIDDVDRLILLDITLEDEFVGQLSERNRVYVQVDEDLILLR